MRGGKSSKKWTKADEGKLQIVVYRYISSMHGKWGQGREQGQSIDGSENAGKIEGVRGGGTHDRRKKGRNGNGEVDGREAEK